MSNRKSNVRCHPERAQRVEGPLLNHCSSGSRGVFRPSSAQHDSEILLICLTHYASSEVSFRILPMPRLRPTQILTGCCEQFSPTARTQRASSLTLAATRPIHRDAAFATIRILTAAGIRLHRVFTSSLRLKILLSMMYSAQLQ